MPALTFHLIPHTHWDREWYLSRAGFQVRLVPVLDALLDQLERDPRARFVLDGQTVLLEDYLAIRPDAARRLARAVRRRALEIGPWYVLADLLVPAGESLVRNLLEGARDAARFGRRMDVLYSPDAFGQPAVLPTLAREFGMGRAVVRRGLGRPVRRDRDFYRWVGPDGADVLVYHLPRPGYEVAIDVAKAGDDAARVWAPVRADLVARSATPQVAVFLGADHHPAPALAALQARLGALESGHTVRVSGLTEFFDAAGQPEAPRIRGELRRIQGHTWVLQGVHGTRARQKRRHALAELGLTRLAEPLAALARWEGRDPRDQRDLLRTAWRTLLQSQFHDTLGGSCCDEVAEEQEVRLGAVEAMSREIAAQSLHRLVGHDPDAARESGAKPEPRLVLWNPAARARSGVVVAEATFFRSDLVVGPPDGRRPRKGGGHRPFTLAGPGGGLLPVQLLGVRRGHERADAERHHPDQDVVDRAFIAFRAPPVPGLGSASLSLRAGSGGRHQGPAVGVSRSGLANEAIAVRFAPGGGLLLEDRRTGETYPGLCVLEDEPDRGDTYTYSADSSGTRRRAGGPTEVRVLARGPLVGAFEATWTVASGGRESARCRAVVALSADAPAVRIRLEVDNQGADHRLRARFPVGAGREAVAGCAYGTERRPPVTPDRRPGAIEQPAGTAPAHRYVAAGSGRRGLAVLAPGFVEYQWTRRRDFVLTLLRAVGELSREDLPERPGHAGWPMPTPRAQEPGLHRLDLVVAPVGARELSDPVRLEHLWEDSFLPVQGPFLRHARAGERAGATGGIAIEGVGLVLTAVKPPETGEGVVLRCYNSTDRAVQGRWVSSQNLRRAVRLRADETEQEALPLARDRRSAAFTAGPRAIITVRLEPER